MTAPSPAPTAPPVTGHGTICAGITADVGVAIAAAITDGVGLVPRSSTGPARHGRAQPRPGTRQLDLSSLDTVVTVNARERVAIIEAGVTHAQLAPLLDDAGLVLDHPLLPPAGKSIVASVMDRAATLRPRSHWDFSDPLLCVELWFGTGDRFRTGSASGPGATLEEQWQAGMHQKNPLGPGQTDLAKLAQGAQGALGFATWASVRLERRPEMRRLLATGADDLAPLAALVAGLTRRRLGDQLLVLDNHHLALVAAALGVAPPRDPSPWWLLVVLGALPRRPAQSLEYMGHEAGVLAAGLGLSLQVLDGTSEEAFVDALVGLTPPSVTSGDWKRQLAGTSREMTFLTTMDRAAPLVALARRRWESTVDPAAIGAYLQPVNQGRTCHVELTACVTETEAVVIDAGLGALGEELADAGAFFAQPTGPLVEVAYRRCPDVVATLAKVKDVLDPHGVLVPGALCFADHTGARS